MGVSTEIHLTDALHVTRAGLEDAALLGRLHSLGWRGAYQGIVSDDYLANFSPEKRTAYFERILPQGANEHYIAWLSDEAIGMLAHGKANDEDLGSDCGEVFALYLLPAQYRKGYGRALMNFAASRLQSLGFARVALWVLEDNRRARRFYEAYGFKADGKREPITLGNTLWEMRYTFQKLNDTF